MAGGPALDQRALGRSPCAKALGIDLCGKVNCRTVARTVDDWLHELPDNYFGFSLK